MLREMLKDLFAASAVLIVITASAMLVMYLVR
jgi:hypothetical protein